MCQKQPARVVALIIVSQAVSLLGSQMSTLAVGLWLFATTGAATPLAFIALSRVLARLLLAGPAGLLADRADRRLVLLAAEGLQALASLLLLLDLQAGAFQIWHLYGLAALQSAGATVQEPALFATIARLVSPQDYTRVNALQHLAGPLAAMLAPALGGLALTAIGVSGVITVDLLTFVVTVGVLMVVRLPVSQGQAAERRSLRDDARAGFHYLASRPDLLTLFALLGLANMVFLGAYLLYPPYILQRTESAALTGALLALIPFGSVVGGALVALGGPRISTRVVLPALALSGASLVAVGLGQTPLILGVALSGLAICPAFVHVPLTSLIQQSVPEGLQGRVFAAQTVFAQLLTPVAYVVVGPLVDTVIEPFVGTTDWHLVTFLVGSRAGSGIGLLLVLGGLAVVVFGLIGGAVGILYPRKY